MSMINKVGITVKLLKSEKDEFKKACAANDTDMAKYLAKQAKLFIAKHKKATGSTEEQLDLLK